MLALRPKGPLKKDTRLEKIDVLSPDGEKAVWITREVMAQAQIAGSPTTRPRQSLGHEALGFLDQ